jgi:hypothetical protein
VKQHPAIKRVFSTLIVLRIPPGQWPGGTGGSPVPPRRCEIYGLAGLPTWKATASSYGSQKTSEDVSWQVRWIFSAQRGVCLLAAIFMPTRIR